MALFPLVEITKASSFVHCADLLERVFLSFLDNSITLFSVAVCIWKYLHFGQSNFFLLPKPSISKPAGEPHNGQSCFGILYSFVL